jgi:hypothetical protein
VIPPIGGAGTLDTEEETLQQYTHRSSPAQLPKRELNLLMRA